MSDAKPWAPTVQCNLTTGQQAFQHAVEQFRKWAAQQPQPVISLTTGWHTITPQLAEQLLICNRRNRKLRYPDVYRYALQMINKRWKKTGEPVIITDRGDLEDAGHRLMACYFSNTPFETFVVTDVPHDDQLFAYIDNGVSRTGEDTLHCAGLNGMSGHLQTVIKTFAIRYDESDLRYYGRSHIPPITNVEILDYANAHPGLVSMAHQVKDVYPAAIKRLDYKIVATFVAWKINEAFGATVLEDFMSLLVEANLPVGHPVLALQQRLDQHEAAKSAPATSSKAANKLNDVRVLALTMHTFNLWRENKTTRKLNLGVEDPFPRIERPDEPDQLAAE